MRAICRALVTTLVLLAASAPPTLAQAPRIDGPRPSLLTFSDAAESTTLRAEMMRSVRPNHWKRGALIGGGIAAALFVALVVTSPGECSFEGMPCVPFVIAGASSVFLLGAFPGAMIGSFFPRDTL